jgi:hypothetical protein
MYTLHGSVQINTPSVHSRIFVHVYYSAPQLKDNHVLVDFNVHFEASKNAVLCHF